MAITKHALIRYKVLDSCFRNTGRRYFIEDLIEECDRVLQEIDEGSGGISLRQIRDDIAFMRSEAGWSIDLGSFREGKKMFYRYTDTSFSINNMPLNDLEINHLKSVLEILAQFKGMPQFEWVNELMPKLKQGISNSGNETVVMEFDNNNYLKGIDNIGILYSAICYKKVLKIKYQPFESDAPSDIIIHPYYLKQYNNRWFLFGYNPENLISDWNLAIDRMILIKEVKEVFIENTTIEWQDYFEDIIGVTKPVDAEIENVVLHFSKSTGKYMETKPLHGSQKSKWIDEYTLEVNLQLMINYELERLILSYADAVKVIKPLLLEKQIKTRLKIASNQY